MRATKEQVEAGRRANQEARQAGTAPATPDAQKAKRSSAGNRLSRVEPFRGVTLTIPWSAMVADNAKHAVMAVRTKGGKAVPRMILTPRYRAAKDAVEHMARKLMRDQTPTDAPLVLHAMLYFPDLRKRDATNYGKLIQDSMSGIVYEDDVQIVRATYERAGIDREHPRCEITITPRAA